jgi:hypothetical protein
MSNLDRESQLWHDFVMGIHQRSIRSCDNEGWSSWSEAGRAFYGEQRYDTIYCEYSRLLSEDEIME